MRRFTGVLFGLALLSGAFALSRVCGGLTHLDSMWVDLGTRFTREDWIRSLAAIGRGAMPFALVALGLGLAGLVSCFLPGKKR